MGEANYKLLAMFESAEKAKEALIKVKPIFDDIVALNDDSYDCRLKSVNEQISILSKHIAWKELNLDKISKNVDDPRNFLSGDIPRLHEEYKLTTRGKVVRLTCEEISHLSEWHPLVELMERYGAIKAEYDTDENGYEYLEDFYSNNDEEDE